MKEKRGAVSAQRLLDRKPEMEYIQEWTELLAKQKELEKDRVIQSVVIFRLANEWLAISTKVFSQIVETRPIHTIPHHSGILLLGLVNFEGLLTPCVSLQKILNIEACSELENISSAGILKRMLALQKEEERWIFPVDEVFGVYHCDLQKLTNVPVTISKSTANYLRGVFDWEKYEVGYLDEELLFFSLKRSVQ